MKDNVMEVLMYIFDHFYEDDNHLRMPQEEISTMLDQAGFDSADVTHALWWLDGLVELCDQADDGSLSRAPGFRAISPLEQALLPVSCQGYLLKLEQLGILDDYSREMVIDRVQALDEDDVSLESVRWVVQMVLFNLPGREQAFASMESFELRPQWH